MQLFSKTKLNNVFITGCITLTKSTLFSHFNKPFIHDAQPQHSCILLNTIFKFYQIPYILLSTFCLTIYIYFSLFNSQLLTLQKYYLYMSQHSTLKNILTITYIITGTVCLIAAKMQNVQWVDEAGIHKQFFHPFMQTVMMFVGEALCLFAYLFMKRKNPQKYQKQLEKALSEGKTPAPKELIIVPAICDFTASCLQYMSLNYIPASIYQMLKGGGIITTFIFSYLLMRGKSKRSQVSGCILALIGIIIVGLAALLFNHSSTTFTSKNIVIGCILMFVSLIINGFQFAFEGKVFSKYYISPLLMVGLEGSFGLVISWCTTVGVMFIPCPFGKDACVYSASGASFFQRPEQFYHQVVNSPILLSMTLLSIFGIAFFNLIGLTIIKYINALARAILNLTKTALVWVIGILVTVTAGKHNSDFEWQLLSWQILVMQSVGFVFLIFSTLIYNGNINVKGLSDPPISDSRITLMTQSDIN